MTVLPVTLAAAAAAAVLNIWLSIRIGAVRNRARHQCRRRRKREPATPDAGAAETMSRTPLSCWC